MNVPHGTETTIRAHGLGRRFGRRWALAHLDLEVRQGEALLLTGPNGSGKTTLLRLLAGLYRPSAGRLSVFGMDPRKERLACRRRLSMVAHESYLYEQLTALETVRVWSRLLGRRSADGALLALLEEVGLGESQDQQVGTFSAGMRKRLALLRTRLEEPQLVLLDEPFAALDAAGQRLVEDWVGEFRAGGVTVVVASHALQRAARLCHRAVRLEGGQLAWQGPAGALPELGEAR